MSSQIEIPDYAVKYAKGMGQNTDVGRWIMSLLPPEEQPPTLKEMVAFTIADEIIETVGYNPGGFNDIASEVLKIVAADIKGKFGWETRVTGYLKEQAQ